MDTHAKQTRLKRPLLSITNLVLFCNTIAIAACLLILYTSSSHTKTIATAPRQAEQTQTDLPNVIIYRRSKKSGSSSMLDQLLRIARPLGYEVVYSASNRMKDIVHSAALQNPNRRFLVAEHNAVTRDDVPGRRAVIVETVMDGYMQMTSHCRYVEKVKQCVGQEMENCLRRLKNLNFYRWAGRYKEDAATYIDLPVSTLHPALSTTILRRVFPNVTLDLQHLNMKGSACGEHAEVRKVYKGLYGEMDNQVNKLRSRMLVLAGYPSSWKESSVTKREMMDKAEELEKERYEKEFGIVFGSGTRKSRSGVSEDHKLMKDFRPHWERNAAGEVVLDDRGHPDTIQ